MDSEHLNALLSVAGTDKEGDWSVLKEERTLTLHAAEAGVPLNIAKIRKIRTKGKLVFAENVTGDVYVVKLTSLFSGLVDHSIKTTRTAGFR